MHDDGRVDSRGARSPTPNITTLLSIGVSFGVCVGIGAVIGILLDHVAGTSPLFVLLGVLMGILVGALGAYQVIRPYVTSSIAASDETTRTSNDSARTSQDEPQHGSEG